MNLSGCPGTVTLTRGKGGAAGGLELLASLANAERGLHSKPGCTQSFNMTAKKYKGRDEPCAGQSIGQHASSGGLQACRATPWLQSPRVGIWAMRRALGVGQGTKEQDRANAS